jgi:hypothetical protein
MYSGYKHCVSAEGRVRVWVRASTYLLIAVASTVAGACVVKYTPGVLHK